MPTDTPKLMIIGLDGADWEIINPFLAEGKLPALRQIIENGAQGMMRSTIPPVTPCAWTTAYTGVNPGRHGVYDFVDFHCGSGEIPLTNGGQRKCPTFMQICSDQGLSVGVLNAPWTYPPDDLDGYVVSGMDTPEFGPGMSRPREIYREIVDLVGEYELEPVQHLWYRDNARIEDIDDETDNLKKVALWLMHNRPTDVFMMVFTITDQVQHGFVGNRSLRSSTGRMYEDVVLHVYECIDAALGEILDAGGDDTPVFLLSDHGGAPFERFVNLDAVLKDLGFLALNETQKNPGSRIKNALWGLGYRVKSLLPDGLLNALRKTGARARETIATELEGPGVDWARTKAIPMPSYGMIRVNVRGRDPAGIVEPGEEYEAVCEEIGEALVQYRDPVDDRPVFSEVLRAGDIYEGPHTKGAPDLVAMRSGTRFHTFSPISVQEKTLNALKPAITPRDPTYTGTHSPRGIFVASGPGLASGKETAEVHLQDFAPTVLAALGIPIPRYMDGHVIEGAFERGAFGAGQPEYTESAMSAESEESASATYSEEETKAVEERLRNLGYF